MTRSKDVLGTCKRGTVGTLVTDLSHMAELLQLVH